MGRMLIVAHRGASAVAPENTLAAFARAIELGVDVIETDVRATRDGELVLIHDDNLGRIAARPEKVAELDFAEMRQVVVGSDASLGAQPIATLDEVLRVAAGRVRVLLDLKLPAGQEAGVLRAIRAANAERDVIVGVRSLAALATLRDASPGLQSLAFGRTLE